MSLTIQKYPDVVVLAGNPVEFTISSDTVVSNNHKIHCRITQNLGSGWKDLGVESLPVLNNTVSFDFADYMKRRIKTDFNIFDFFSKAIRYSDNRDLYYFYFYETYDGDGINHNQVTWGSLMAIQGGFPKLFLANYLASQKTFLQDFINTDKKFLTWAPQKKLIRRQHDLLYFLAPVSGAAVNVRAKYVIQFSDTTTSTVYSEYMSLQYGKVHYLSPSILANEFDLLETSSKKISYYDVSVVDSGGTAYTETRRYYVDNNSYNNYRQFVFRNSIGGYDMIILKGVSENTNHVERTVGYFSTQDETTYTEMKEGFDVASGFLVTQYKTVAEAQRYISELYLSKEIYELVGRELVLISPTLKKLVVNKDKEFLYSFKFEYEYAHADNYFAPFDSEQYLNPRLFYSNGAITPQPASAGGTATLNFDVVINEDALIDFMIDWGNDIGITYLNDESFTKDVSRSLESEITIPAGISGTRSCVITDSKGGKYTVTYQIGTNYILYNNGDSMLYNDGNKVTFN